MEQYFVIVLTQSGSVWTSHSRDFPHLRTTAASPERAFSEAAHAVRMEAYRLQSEGRALPPFRTYADLRIDDAFSRERGIRWSSAIVRMAALPPQLKAISRPIAEEPGGLPPIPAKLPRAS